MEKTIFKENNSYYTLKKESEKNEVVEMDVEPLVKEKVNLPLYELCSRINNFFIREIIFDCFEIKNGKISLNNKVVENQYFRIIGSVFNDGVYQNTADLELTDEKFDGAVWSMAVPSSVIDLAAQEFLLTRKLEEISNKYSGYSSEGYPNGYSYSVSQSLPEEIRQEISKIKSLENSYRRISVL